MFSDELTKNDVFPFLRSCDFSFNFFSFFSKMRQSMSTLPVVFFMNFCVAQTFCVEQVLQMVGSNKYFTKLVGFYHTHWKNYDDCFINEGDN